MRKFVDGILNLFPLIAPIPTAWAIAEALRIHLGWPLPILIIAAVAIESIGFVAADTAAKYYEFNRSARPGELKAPAWMAYLTNIAYFGVALTMTLIYEPMAALFPGLSGVGFFLFVLRKDYGEREQARKEGRARLEQEKQEKKEAAKLARQEKKQEKKLAETKKETARKPLKDDELLTFFAGNPGVSDTQAAEHFGVSRQAIGQRRKKLYSIK